MSFFTILRQTAHAAWHRLQHHNAGPGRRVPYTQFENTLPQEEASSPPTTQAPLTTHPQGATTTTTTDTATCVAMAILKPANPATTTQMPPTQLLQAAEEPNSTTPLHQAISKALSCIDTAAEQALMTIKQLANAHNVNVCDKQGLTPLHLVTKTSLWKDTRHSAIVMLLLSAGADVNVVNHQKRSALHLLMLQGKCPPDIVEMLIQAGADVNAKDQDLNTPLYLLLAYSACNSHDLTSQLIKTLAKHKADINAIGPNGLTPLHIAIECQCPPDILMHLVDYGANINAPNNYQETPLHYLASMYPQAELVIDYFLSKGGDPHTANSMGQLPFHKAHQQYPSSKVLAALEPTNKQQNADSNGITPLHLITDNPHIFSNPQMCASFARLKRLIAITPNPIAADKLGRTPLHNAAANGFYEAIKALLPLFTDINVLDRDKKSPLDYAVLALLNNNYPATIHEKDLPSLRKIVKTLSHPEQRFVEWDGMTYQGNGRLQHTINVLLDAGANPWSSILMCQAFLRTHGATDDLRKMPIK